MPANPQILSDLHNYVSEKIGRPVDGAAPPTGGDGKKPPEKNARIPLPDFTNLASREKYAQALKGKYGLPSGYGDTFLHLNEVPDTRADSLTSKQIALKAAKIANIPAPLLHASQMVEGMSGLYPYGKNQDVDFSGNEKFPVSGYANFGLDTFSDAYPTLVKKGYLPADFNKQFIKSVHPARKGDNKVPVNSANFSSAEAASMAKAAMIRHEQDQMNAYAAKNKIPLTDQARHFLTLAAYNGGPGAGQGLLQDFKREGLLANDAFLTKKPKQSQYGKVYNNIMDRFHLANASSSEGQWDENAPTQITSTPIIDK